jgi:glycine cleavage system H protein
MAKAISELIFMEDVRYAKDHEWAKKEGDKIKIGISDYAQDQLGDIVFVELPEAGDEFKKGAEFGTVESTKAVSELFMPVSGKVTAINELLTDSPELVNNDPYAQGWIIAVEPADLSEFNALMDKTAYLNMLKGL